MVCVKQKGAVLKILASAVSLFLLLNASVVVHSEETPAIFPLIAGGTEEETAGEGSGLVYMQTASQDGLSLFADRGSGRFYIEDTGGNRWYSNPDAAADDPSASGIHKVELQSLIVAEVLELKTGQVTRKNSEARSVRQDGAAYREIGGGFRMDYTFGEEGMIIPVEIRIGGGMLTAHVPVEEIREEKPEEYRLMSLSVLPFFGAAGREETGYALLPDGSGSLMYFNNGKLTADEYAMPVYGRDQALNLLMKPADSHAVQYPVYGMKSGDKAYLAVISRGAAQATIRAAVNGQGTSYAHAYSQFTLRASDSFVLGEETGNPQTAALYQEEDIAIDGVEVQFRFLQAEAADYSGMAAVYRQYLQETYGIKEHTVAGTPLYLDIHGAVMKKKSILGIPFEVEEQLSDLADIQALAQQLYADGVSALEINLKSWSRDALSGKVDGSLKPSGKLGGSGELQALSAYLGKQGGTLYPELGIQLFNRSGNGVSRFSDVTKSMSNAPAFIASYYESTRLRNKNIPRQSMLAGGKLPELLSRIAGRADTLGLMAFSFPALYVYSDFGDPLVSRSGYAAALSTALEKLGDRALLMDNPPDFLLGKAAGIVNLPVESSGKDLTDESVPFVQLALSGLLPYAVPPVNLGGAEDRLVLKALATGAARPYRVITKATERVIDTTLNGLLSADPAHWTAQMLEEYQTLEEVRRAAGGTGMVSHRRLAPQVTETAYANGTRVLVNYSGKAYTDGTVTVEAGGYALLAG